MMYKQCREVTTHIDLDLVGKDIGQSGVQIELVHWKCPCTVMKQWCMHTHTCMYTHTHTHTHTLPNPIGPRIASDGEQKV